MRHNVIYSSYLNPEARSRLRILQRTAAVVLTLFPWFGLVAGLFGAMNYLIERYDRLKPAVTDSELAQMQLQAPSTWEIAVSAIALGVSGAFFLDFYKNNRFVQWAGIFITPLAAAVLLMLLINSSLGPGSEAARGSFGNSAVMDQDFGTIDVFTIMPIPEIEKRYIAYFGSPSDTRECVVA